MERMADDDRVNTVLASLREYHAEHATEDSELDPPDRRDRADVCPGTPLKIDDDVYIGAEEHPTRVACAATGREYFYGCYLSPEDGPWVGKYHVSQITDRAPLDPSETPMPVYTPPPESSP